MRRSRSLAPLALPSLAPFAACLALAPLACSSAPHGGAEANTATEVAALDAPNGGLDLTSREAPAFGDPEVESLPVMAPVSTGAPAPTTSASTSFPGGLAYRLVLVWGHLPPAHDADATDVPATSEAWTGTISLDAGALTPLRTIAFGAGDTLEAAASAPSLAFQTQTGGFVDGVLVRVVIPEGTAPLVHFAANLVTFDVDVSKLGDAPGGIARAQDGVSGLGWTGFGEDLCTRGFLLGRWVKDAPAIGRSFAVVSDEDGELLGYVRGGWGYAPGRSDEVWFDKYIDTTGAPQGLGYGWYGDGAYHGVWAATDEHDVSALDIGPTSGFYSDADDTGDGRGVWLGRWSGPCTP